MKKIGFIGLGKIGYRLSGNISKKFDTYVWNRTTEKIKKHNEEYNSKFVNRLSEIAICDIILFCLPTFNEVNLIIDNILPFLKKDTILIDCTSSDYQVQREIYKKLIKKNIFFFDAPVSGGPEKAKTGEITCMVSGDKNKFYQNIEIFKSFSKPIYVGKIGNACAIKSINNILNVSHLCLAAEALSSLEKIGIDKNIALEVINKSSGRSLMTEERIPKHIIEKNYHYGFSLGLMNKDVNLALNIIKNPFMFAKVSSLLKKSIEKYGKEGDYTEIAKLYFEKK